MERLNTLPAHEAERWIARGQITSEGLVAACLERIESREDLLGAWDYIDPVKALQEARMLDQRTPQGPLHGIPVGLKDTIETADMPTSYGSPIYEGHRPPRDASCVARIRGAGGLILGKTATTEFALYPPTKTVNPHNLAHTPGGSSSGSAAAVADFMVPLAIGTQTAGSVIRPAAFCGIVGFKPSFDLIDRRGVRLVSETLETIGILARNIEDVALLGEVLTGQPLSLGTIESDSPTIGLCPTTDWRHASSETIWALEEASKRLKDHGMPVEEVKLPPPFSQLPKAHATVMAFEAARSLAHEHNNHKKHLSPNLREFLASGSRISLKEYDKALSRGAECRALLQQVFSVVDFIVTPSTIGEAPKGLSSTGDPVFNRTWTFLYTPCIHLPIFKGPQGLPLGIQVVGPFGEDARLLGASHKLMECFRSPSV